jgi:hypothetical protein
VSLKRYISYSTMEGLNRYRWIITNYSLKEDFISLLQNWIMARREFQVKSKLNSSWIHDDFWHNAQTKQKQTRNDWLFCILLLQWNLPSTEDAYKWNLFLAETFYSTDDLESWWSILKVPVLNGTLLQRTNASVSCGSVIGSFHCLYDTCANSSLLFKYLKWYEGKLLILLMLVMEEL